MQHSSFCRSVLSMSQIHTCNKHRHNGFQLHECTCEQSMLHTPSISADMHFSHMLLQPAHTQTQRDVLSLIFTFLNVCLCSLFPCHHLHPCYYNNYRPKNCSLLICCLPFCLPCSPGNKPPSLSPSLTLSLSFLPFFVQSSLLLLLRMLLSVTVRSSRPSHPLSLLSSLPVFSRLTWLQLVLTDSIPSGCPPVL